MKKRNFNIGKRNSKRFISVILSIIIALSLIPLSAFNVFAGIDAWNSVGFLRNDGTDSVTSINWFNPSCMELGSNGASRDFNGVTVTRNNSYTLTFNGSLNGDVTFGVLPISVETGSNYTISIKCIGGSVTNGSGRLVMDYITGDDRQLEQAGLGLSRYNFDFIGTASDTKYIQSSSYSSAIRGIKFWAWRNNGLAFNNFKIEIRIFKGTQADESQCNPLNMPGHIQTNAGFYSITPPTREGYDFLGYWDTASGAGYQCIQSNGAPLPGRTVPNVGKMILYARWAPKTSRVTYNYNDGTRGENLFDASGLGEFTYIANGMTFTKLDSNGKIKVSGTFSQNETVVYKKPMTLSAAAHTFTVDILGEDIPAGACVLEFYDANGNQFGDRSKIDVTRQGGQTSLSIDATRASQIREFRIWFWPNNGTRTVNNFVIVPKLVKNGSTQNLLTIDKSGNPTPNGIVIERVNDTQIKFNGYLPSGSSTGTYLKVPFNPTVGSTYTLSSKTHSGSVSNGCGVFEFYNSSLESLGTRFYNDIRNSDNESSKAATSDIKYYAIKIWNNGGVTFNNLIVTLRIEKRSGATPANLMANKVTIGSAMPTITPPTRNGYNFLGFFDAASGGTKYYNADGTSAKAFDKTADTVLYAQWSLKETNSLAINPNGGVYNSNTSTTYINQAPDSTYTLLTPTRTAYEFAGWTAPTVGSISGSIYTFGIGDAQINANWTPTSYTVSFDTDGGDTLANTTYNTQSNSTLPTPTRVGSTFSGWRVVTADGNWTVGSTMSAGANLNGKYGNVSLKAQWSAASYTSKSADTEYYYPAGTQFVEYIGIVHKGMFSTYSLPDKLREYGYPNVLGKDLNDGARGDYIRMGYSTTTDISRAVRAVGYYCGGDRGESLVYNGSTYYLVGSSSVVSNHMADGAVDLNSDAGGKYIYAYASKDIKAGPPVTSIDTGSSPSATFPNAVGLWIGKSDGEDVTIGTAADLNKGIGGSDDIFSYQYSSCTTVDSTALRQTMNQAAALLQNYSVYTESSVANLRSALSAAMPCYNALQSYAASTNNQTAINNLNSNLISAINALQSTVYLDSNGGTLDGSADELAVELTFGSAQTVDFVVSDYVPTKEGYEFLGWAKSTTAVLGNTESVNISFNEHLYAVFTEKYFISYNLNDGIVNGNPEYYTSGTATITLINPTKAGFAFLGWTGSNGSTPQTTVTIAQGSTGDKSYTANWEAIQYTVTVPSTCTVEQVLRSTISDKYYVATITAPQRDGNNYFVYWTDGDGNIVSTYYKYSFFVVCNISLTPVYATQQDYYTERDRGIISSRVVDIRDNGDTESYSILAEHSVAKSVGTIIGHGVIYTTDASQKDLLTVDNDNVMKKSAGLSSRTLTGLLEVTIDPGAASKIWARTYVLDSENNPVYGDVKEVSLSPTTASVDEEPIIISSMSLDSTELNESESDVVNEPVEEPTEEPTVGKLLSIWQIILMLIESIFSIFKGVSL